MAKGELFNQKEMRRLWGVSAMGMELVGAIAILALLGWAADRQLGSEPWLLFVGIVIGTVGGGANFIRRAREMTRASAASGRSPTRRPSAPVQAKGPEAYEKILEEERARAAGNRGAGALGKDEP